MALLHWACDRGLDEMAQLLLMFRADINITVRIERILDYWHCTCVMNLSVSSMSM